MKIACPMCKRKLEVTERQIRKDVACPCGVAFTLEEQMYRAAANRRLLVVIAAVGSMVVLTALAAVFLFAPAKKKTVAGKLENPAAETVAQTGNTPAGQPEAPSVKNGTAAPAAVTLPAPAAWWKLDETAGQTAAESAGGGRSGTLKGFPVWKPARGVHGGALSLNGSVQHVAIATPFRPGSGAVTITAWLKPSGKQIQGGGIVFCNQPKGGNGTGIFVQESGELRYAWNGQYGDIPSGLLLPNAWCFVALCVKSDEAVLWMGTSSGLARKINRKSHAADAFGREIHLGNNAKDPTFSFKGMIDDVRIYDAALEPEQLELLYIEGRKALAANPAATTDDPPPEVRLAGLSWNHAAFPHVALTAWTLDARPLFPSPGNYRVTLRWQSGESAVGIRRVVLLQNGKELADDRHDGWAGADNTKNDYDLAVPVLAPGTPAILRMEVVPSSSTDSNGTIDIKRR